MNESIEFLKKDRYASLTGIELVSASEGHAVARMVIKECHLNGLGSVQGGAIFTLADYTFAAASNSISPITVGINANISYIRPGGNQGVLTAEARPSTTNRKLGSFIVEVKNEQGEIIATFHGLSYHKK